jgi:hypothetical protein
VTQDTTTTRGQHVILDTGLVAGRVWQKFYLDHRPANEHWHRPVRQHFSTKKVRARASPITTTVPKKASPQTGHRRTRSILKTSDGLRHSVTHAPERQRRPTTSYDDRSSKDDPTDRLLRYVLSIVLASYNVHHDAQNEFGFVINIYVC